MKNLELTKEQKQNLLEMCKTLFPEIKYFQMGGAFDTDCIWYTTNDVVDEKIDDGWRKIHWVEVCFTHLYDKLIKESFNNRLFLLSILDKETDIHIVDYLYQEFLKLK